MSKLMQTKNRKEVSLLGDIMFWYSRWNFFPTGFQQRQC